MGMTATRGLKSGPRTDIRDSVEIQPSAAVQSDAQNTKRSESTVFVRGAAVNGATICLTLTNVA